MIRPLTEFILSILDFAYCLYFYKLIIQEKIHIKNFIIAILCMTLFQCFKELFFSFTSLSIIIDSIVMIVFLYINTKEKNFKNFVTAMIVDTIFSTALMVFISISVELGLDIDETLSFGMLRVIFALCMKVFIILCFIVLRQPLQKLRNSFNEKIDALVILLLSFIGLCLPFVTSYVKGNRSIIIYASLLVMITILVFYLLYRYGILLKQHADQEVIERTMQITSAYVEGLEKEHDEVRKIRHDMKNQLQVMRYLLRDKKYDEVEQNLSDLTEELDVSKVSISGNVYIDAVLRQKMVEYSDIEFQLDLVVTNDFKMNGTDLVSLLTNIIDNACEELRRIQESEMTLNIKGSGKQLIITERNICRRNHDFETTKNKKEHGYGLKIIQEIANKYDGNIEKHIIDDVYELSVFILF